MSKKSLLKNAFSSIQVNKPLVLPKRSSSSHAAETEKTCKSSALETEYTDNRDTEDQYSNHQDTHFQNSDLQHTENKNPETSIPDNPVTQQQEKQRLVFGSNEKSRDIAIANIPKRKPKAKSVSLRRKTATENQIGTFINPKYSKSQVYMHLAEQETLGILREEDPTRALKGNEWPVYLFMLLKAYEWDHSKKKRRDGKRNFATEYVASGTGLSSSTAFEVINRLIVKGYIKVISAHPTGNIYHVSPILFYRKDPDSTQPNGTENQETDHNLEKKEPVESERANSPNQVNEHTENQDASTPKISIPHTENQNIPNPIISKSVYRKSETILNTLNSINLSLLESHFDEIYFSRIRATKAVAEEKNIFSELVKRNGDVTFEEFQKCFEIVGETKDKNGKPVVKKFLWLSRGFDQILESAKKALKEKTRKVESSLQSAERAQREQEEVKGLEELEVLRKAKIKRLTQVFPKTELATFVEEVLSEAPNAFLTTMWEKSGWESIALQNHVLDYFLEVENGQRRSALYSTRLERTA